MSDGIILAMCQQQHRLAWLVDGEKGHEIHYWVAVAGLAMREPHAVDNGHSNYAPHESIEPLIGAQSGAREIMCQHQHGGEGTLNFADLLPVIKGERPPLIVNV